MVLQIKNQDSFISLNFSRFEDSSNSFILEGVNNSMEVVLPYILKKYDSFNPDDFIVYIVHHNSLPESHIFQLYEKNIDNRIGWIFPIQSLLSNNHEYQNNEHFLKLAYVAFYKLICSHINTVDKDNLLRIPSYTNNDYSLIDFYNSESVIIILHKPEIEKIPDFSIDNYIPALYKYGYTFVFNPLKNIHPLVKSEFFDEGQEDQLKKRINIRPISSSLKDEDFLRKLFGELLIKEKHPLVKFYWLYQVIELLIIKIFEKRFNKVISTLIPKTEEIFDLRDKILELSSEKKRINILLSEYTKSDSEELRLLCIDFLGVNESENQKINIGDLIYRLRSFLVHNFRQISDRQYNLIKDINHHFERLIISILIEYTEPQSY